VFENGADAMKPPANRPLPATPKMRDGVDMSELSERWDPRKVALNRDKQNQFLLRPGQILAGPGDAPDVQKVLTGWKPSDRRTFGVTTFTRTPANPEDPAREVLDAIAKVRKATSGRPQGPVRVAPNHVLVPANWHTCPWSPPEPPEGQATLGAQSGAPVDVVVIDSGYIAQGPIVSRIEPEVDYGEWFTKLPGQSGYGWVSQPREVLDAGGIHKDRRLDTLAGHASFVAGVVAQASPRARITVVNHNGAFVQQDVADTPIPTEASVARSLWNHRNASVINVGFAFATLPNTRTLANSVDPSGPPSWTLGLALRGRPGSSMLVAPAGNQSSRVRQYPAAFSLDHPNVAGVGSLDPRGGRSVFSNHGAWVACCTEGEEVLSSFVTRWRGRTEDAEPPGSPAAGTYPVKDFTSGWALWSGTSFAAPKVAGAIAQAAGPGKTPLAAWIELKQSAQPSGLLDMGIPLKGLAPA